MSSEQVTKEDWEIAHMALHREMQRMEASIREWDDVSDSDVRFNSDLPIKEVARIMLTRMRLESCRKVWWQMVRECS
jgi:hypothetical protein